MYGSWSVITVWILPYSAFWTALSVVPAAVVSAASTVGLENRDWLPALADLPTGAVFAVASLLLYVKYGFVDAPRPTEASETWNLPLVCAAFHSFQETWLGLSSMPTAASCCFRVSLIKM